MIVPGSKFKKLRKVFISGVLSATGFVAFYSASWGKIAREEFGVPPSSDQALRKRGTPNESFQ
jgi:hypothetical protein